MERFFNHYTGDIQADIFLTAAQNKGWNVDVILSGDYSLAEITKAGLKYRVNREILSVNSGCASRIASDKYFTHLVLKKKIPFVTQPHKLKISEITDEHLKQLLNSYHEWVVKPLNRNNGVGITTSLRKVADLKLAIDQIRVLGDSFVIVEKQVPRISEYRIIVWKGEVIDVLLRIPAYVIGDGISSISSLIESKNDYRRDVLGGVFEPIIIRPEMMNTLSSQGFTIDSILEKNKKLTVEELCNLSLGGEVCRVELETVHPEYLKMARLAYEATALNYYGIDLITPDIGVPPRLDTTAINELNASPGISLAFYDDVATNRPFFGSYKILDKMEKDPVYN